MHHLKNQKQNRQYLVCIKNVLGLNKISSTTNTDKIVKTNCFIVRKIFRSDKFLVAMSSSRSDVLTQFVLLVSLKCILVLKSFNGVSRKFKGYLKFQGCFKEVLRVSTESFKEVSGVFQGGLRKFQVCL